MVRELSQARLLSRPHVVDAVDALLAEGRAIAEDRLYGMVRDYGLPDPVWNVDLRLPGGPHLGGVDAYWPEQAVAVELDTRAPRQDDGRRCRSEYARKREHLERLGITVVHVTPKQAPRVAGAAGHGRPYGADGGRRPGPGRVCGGAAALTSSPS